jgi:hypothetical protein
MLLVEVVLIVFMQAGLAQTACPRVAMMNVLGVQIVKRQSLALLILDFIASLI